MVIPKNEFEIIAKQNTDEPRFVIRSWMKNTNTIQHLYEWEQEHYTKINRVHLDTVLGMAVKNSFSMTPTKWIDLIGVSG